MKKHLDEKLSGLKEDILKMWVLVEESILRSVESLKDLSDEKAERVIAEDRVVDELELEIDEKGLDLLELQRPMGAELRFVTMAMKINTEMERMADLAVDIAQCVLEVADKPPLKPVADIPKLMDVAQRMLKGVIGAFINKDVGLAGEVIEMDSEADKLRNLVQKKLVNDYMAKDPATAARAVPLLLIARHLERICDHATNIAEDVIYMCSAKVVKHHPEKLKDVH